jgi:hypothetical protein
LLFLAEFVQKLQFLNNSNNLEFWGTAARDLSLLIEAVPKLQFLEQLLTPILFHRTEGSHQPGFGTGSLIKGVTKHGISTIFFEKFKPNCI